VSSVEQLEENIGALANRQFSAAELKAIDSAVSPQKDALNSRR